MGNNFKCYNLKIRKNMLTHLYNLFYVGCAALVCMCVLFLG